MYSINEYELSHIKLCSRIYILTDSSNVHYIQIAFMVENYT